MASSNTLFVSIFLFYTCLFYLIGIGITPDLASGSTTSSIITFVEGLTLIPIVGGLAGLITPLITGILITFSGTFPVIITTLLFAPIGIIVGWVLFRTFLGGVLGDGS